MVFYNWYTSKNKRFNYSFILALRPFKIWNGHFTKRNFRSMSSYPLLQSDISLGNFLNSIEIGILFIDQNGKIASPNSACSKILKMEVSELIGSNFETFLEENSKLKFKDIWSKLINHKENVDSDVTELKLIDNFGKTVPVELNINSSLTVSDQLYIVILNDISTRRKLEAEVEKQISNKEEIVDELHKEQELGELKSRFVTMASHEFRTPLAGVLSSTNLILRYLSSMEELENPLIHKEKIEKHCHKIQESVGNLTQILNKFLSVGKLEEGKISCKWERVKLEELASEIRKDLLSLCKDGQNINLDSDLGGAEFILDANMCTNILNNLLSNAIKYSGKNSNIYLRLRANADLLKIDVEDNGLGIPMEDQKNLFNRFFRAKNSTNIQGTGLGLNIVKKYVDLMNGEISFTSELNKGTTFSIQIPRRNEI